MLNRAFVVIFQIDGQFYTGEMISLLLESSEDNEEHQRMIQLNHSLMEPYLVELKFSSFQPLKLNLARSEISTMSVFDFADEVCDIQPLCRMPQCINFHKKNDKINVTR
jgi:hypothetical protein